MEIIIGSAQNLSVIDLKQNISTEQNYWNTYQGNSHRSGVYVVGDSNNILLGDLNSDGTIDILSWTQPWGLSYPTPPKKLDAGDV